MVLVHIIDGQAAYCFGAAVPVDLFFSLSGFLIAQMIAERFDGISSPAAFWAFMANRWLRTLPLYILALCACLASIYALAPGPVDLAGTFFQFATFTQYIPWYIDNVAGMHFFIVSWSLAIEEWFYLLCPLLLLLAGRRSTRFFIGAAAILVTASIVYRLVVAVTMPSIPHSIIHTSTLPRADAFIFGIGAYFMIRRGISVRFSMACAAAGMVLATVNFALVPLATLDLYTKVLTPSLAPLSMALLIPAALTLKASQSVAKAAAWLSTRTYAIYLFHVFVIVLTFAPGHRTIGGFFLFMLTTGLLADFLYRYVERPFMRLRPMRAPVSAPALAE